MKTEGGAPESGRPVWIFTGQPGVRVTECLARLSARLPGTANIVSVEAHLCAPVKDVAMGQDSDQREAWRQAFQDMVQELSTSAQTTWAALHAVYLNPERWQFSCPVDVPLISSSFGERVVGVVTLIDDIYDVYFRLLEPGQLFANAAARRNEDPVLVSVSNLLWVLRWRHAEVAQSLALAGHLGVPHYLLATKHPLLMVARLLDPDNPELKLHYLSHPITSIREQGKVLDPFTGELKGFCYPLLNDPGSFTFLPTTIDEKRLLSDRPGHFVPQLKPRWPLFCDEHETLAPPSPPQWAGGNPFAASPPATCPQADGQEVGQEEDASAALWLLLQEISDQVGWRDLMLVEQAAHGVIAYRPFYPDKLSTGVRAELEHNKKLASGHPERRVHVFANPQDTLRSRIRSLFAFLQAKFDLTPEQKRTMSGLELEALASAEWLDFCEDLTAHVTQVRTAVENRLGGDSLKPAGAAGGGFTRSAYSEEEEEDRIWSEVVDAAMRSEARLVRSCSGGQDIRVCAGLPEALDELRHTLSPPAQSR
jgi:hypothetical protein